jgi:hypothetical protein
VELYLEGLPGVVEERTDVCSEARDSVRAPGEEERDEEEPGEEAEVLAGGDVVGRVVEVGAVKDSPKTKARAKQRGREEGRGSPWRRRRSSRAKPKAAARAPAVATDGRPSSSGRCWTRQTAASPASRLTVFLFRRLLYWCHLAHSSPTQRQEIRWARPAHLTLTHPSPRTASFFLFDDLTMFGTLNILKN